MKSRNILINRSSNHVTMPAKLPGKGPGELRRTFIRQCHPVRGDLFSSEIGHSQRLDISNRAGDAAMPLVTIEDMRKSLKKGESSIISPLLEEKIHHSLERNEQCILFLNRRGFTPFTICEAVAILLPVPIVQ